MRKALNVLQSTSMASDIVSATNVYICTGTPLPEDIEAIMSKMVTESFTDAFRFVSGLKVDKGLALVDIVRDLHSLVFTIDFDVESRLFILDRLAQLEERMASGANESLQLADLIGTFQVVRHHALDQAATASA
eukprot:m.59116 g.59116  ORF g.59116 m.59116 type:complete len:134 (-) comp11750_c0_seq2:1642-2043(-)